MPVTAWTFADSEWKFHHGLFLDAKMITFVPIGKLRKCVRAKIGGESRPTIVRIRDCPGVRSISRAGGLDPPNFFKTTQATRRPGT